MVLSTFETNKHNILDSINFQIDVMFFRMITITPSNQSYCVPPPVGNMTLTAPGAMRFPPPHHNQNRFNPRNSFFKPFTPYIRGVSPLDADFDGKRLRKSAMRKTVDYNSAIIKMIEVSLRNLANLFKRSNNLQFIIIRLNYTFILFFGLHL